MDDRELNREIERAQRNAKKLAALQAENERTTAEVAALLTANPRPASRPRVASIPRTGVRA